jgi:hypothetical protein
MCEAYLSIREGEFIYSIMKCTKFPNDVLCSLLRYLLSFCKILLTVVMYTEQFNNDLCVKGKKKKRVKLSLYRPWRPLGLREVEADNRLTDGGKVVSPTRCPLFTLIPGTHFS